MKRRRFLQTGIGSLAFVTTSAWGLGRDSQLDIAELQRDDDFLSRKSAWERGLFEVMRSTSIDTTPRSVTVSPQSNELFAHPFTVLIGASGFAPFSNEVIENLRKYLVYGGFLLIDDASGRKESDFRESVKRLSRRLFPTQRFIPLPADHSLYRSFFLLSEPLGRMNVSNVMEGVQLGSIWPLLFCPNDLSGALEQSDDGSNKYPVVPGGEIQRTEAIKLMINLVMYALTSNYKHDQAHVAELMRRGGL